MFKMNIKEWALSFFSNTKVTDENTIVSTQPEHIYDLRYAMTLLKYALQDDAISRIPPDAKLPHKHYQHPAVFAEQYRTDKLYVVLEKFEKDGHYVETYLRETDLAYYVGFESRKYAADRTFSKNPDDCDNHDVCLFEVKKNTRLYAEAIKYLDANGLSDLSAMKRRYGEREAAMKELIGGILN